MPGTTEIRDKLVSLLQHYLREGRDIYPDLLNGGEVTKRGSKEIDLAIDDHRFTITVQRFKGRLHDD